MARIILVTVLASALFFSGAYYFGLFDDMGTSPVGKSDGPKKVKPASELGKDLYTAKDFDPIPPSKRLNAEPTVVYGTMNAVEQEEVPSLVNGRVLFVGEQVEDEAFLVGGSAAFLAEPYYFGSVFTGEEFFVKFYRRLYEGDPIFYKQMVALIEPAEALGEVLAKMAKIEIAVSEHKSAMSAEAEGLKRYVTQIDLKAMGATSPEEFRASQLTYEKLKYERETKGFGISMAKVEKAQSDIKLHMHEIRPLLPYKQSVLKTIVRQRGAAVKQLEPVVVVQNLGKLQAEALIEEQYFAPLRNRDHITATIEPTILEKPFHEFDALEITSVAVAKDMKIVSGSEDASVSVWSPNSKSPLLKLDTDEAVRVVACTPAAADKNLCIAGCNNGSIYLWNLDDKAPAPIVIGKDKAHGGENAITAIAFSPDGAYFATGASDGSIRLWNADATLKYAFTPEKGVEKSHEDAVTALHFTPQCRLISAGRDKTLRVWRLKELGAHLDGKAVQQRKGNVPNLGVSQDGRYMLFDRDQTLQLLSVEKRTLQQTLNVPVNSTPFETLAQFSPDGTLILTAGAPEGRLQLWRTPEGDTRSFEVRQFATKERQAVTSAAFAPNGAFAVSASGQKIYMWNIPSAKEVSEHRIERVRMTLKTQSLDASTRQTRVGFEVVNEFSARYPNGRFEAGRPVTIVID